MPGIVKMLKVKNYPRPHNLNHSWLKGMEDAGSATIYPIIMSDEGLGTPSAYEANPEHASFVEAAEPNCFPESRIDFIIAEIEFSYTKVAKATDGIIAFKLAFMPIFTTFLDDLTANDELSGLDISEILELTSEATDRQTFPLYTDAKVVEKFSNSALLAVNVPGLTTTQVLEEVAFQKPKYYDALHYYTNGPKLKVCQGGLKWLTLSEKRPVITVRLKIRRKTKYMNPYTFMGVLIDLPQSGAVHQLPIATDTTDIQHLGVNMTVRYNEWNDQFNFKRV